MILLLLEGVFVWLFFEGFLFVFSNLFLVWLFFRSDIVLFLIVFLWIELFSFDDRRNLLIFILSRLFGSGLENFENNFLVNGLDGNRF